MAELLEAANNGMKCQIQKQIVWFVPKVNPSQSSIRLRCLHFAFALEKFCNYKSIIVEDEVSAIKALRAGCFFIVIKHLSTNQNIWQLIYRAKALGCRLVFDICDNLTDSAHKSNAFNFYSFSFRQIIEVFDLILVPTNSLRQALYLNIAKASRTQYETKIKVLPDIMETAADVNQLLTYLDTGKLLESPQLVHDFKTYFVNKGKSKRQKRLLWFGNDYSPTSNMGVTSLIPISNVLRKLQGSGRFKLVICTSASVDRDLLDSLRIDYEFVEWSLVSIFQQLDLASATLLTTGDDSQCISKSNNRALLSLGSGCPVIVWRMIPNMIELIDVVEPSIKPGIQKLLLDGDSHIYRQDIIERGRTVLSRYTLLSITQMYDMLLRNLIFHSELASHNTSIRPIESAKISIFADTFAPSELEELSDIATSLSAPSHLKYIHLVAPTPELINYYESKQIIPYVIKPNKLPESDQLFVNDLFIVYHDSDSGMKFVLKKLSQRISRLKPINFSSFIVSHKDAKQKSINLDGKNLANDHSRVDYASIFPDNIPGRFLPVHIGSFDLDLLIVVAIENKNWILDGIAKEIGSRADLKWSIYYCPKKPTFLPHAKNIVFMHQALLRRFVRLNMINLSNSSLYCWYTHPRDEDASQISEYLEIFKGIQQVIFTCSTNRALWVKRGLPEERGKVIIGGYDSKLFLSHKRTTSAVGLCSSFYERKNPMLLLEVLRLMRHRQFYLVGTKWQEFSFYDYLVGLGNFTYQTIPYARYPSFYSNLSVFLSLSSIEGGPIPLLEAMASNCFPVVSDTGFARDIIDHGVNGFIFPVDSDPRIVAEYIDRAIELKNVNIAHTVSEFSWTKFAEKFCQEFKL